MDTDAHRWALSQCAFVSIRSFLTEWNLWTNHEPRLVSVEAVDHKVRKRVIRDVRRNARHFARAHCFFADVLDRVVIHSRVDVDQVVAALSLPGDVD